MYVALALLVAFNLAFTANFATVGNLRLQLIQVVPVAIVALGMALVIGTEGIDLSVGATMAIAAALLPLYLGYGPWVAIPIALAAGCVVGLVNGGLVAFVGVQPIVATLGLLVAGRGIALVIAQGRLTELFDPTLGGHRDRPRSPGSRSPSWSPRSSPAWSAWPCGAPPSAGAWSRSAATAGPASSPACPCGAPW